MSHVSTHLRQLALIPLAIAACMLGRVFVLRADHSRSIEVKEMHSQYDLVDLLFIPKASSEASFIGHTYIGCDNEYHLFADVETWTIVWRIRRESVERGYLHAILVKHFVALRLQDEALIDVPFRARRENHPFDLWTKGVNLSDDILEKARKEAVKTLPVFSRVQK